MSGVGEEGAAFSCLPLSYCPELRTATRKSWVSSLGLKSYATRYSSWSRSALRGTLDRRRSFPSADVWRELSPLPLPVVWLWDGTWLSRVTGRATGKPKASVDARLGKPVTEILLARWPGAAALAVPVSFFSTNSSTSSVAFVE